MDTPTVLDWKSLLALRSLQPAGEPDVVQEIVSIFLTDSTGFLREANDGQARNDRPSVMRAAHRLRGSAAMLGAQRLTLAAAALEREAKNQQSELRPHLLSMATALEEVQFALRSNGTFAR